ncbi:MAG: Gfo/Idh/MocA family oxidoreductase [Armatimonadetes bacterium]|nr:Gfo/Idh/MocA family oxidoreductase [Armatimonadota bacterium]MDI9585008.1 Gfo/Idh/MocA family oxidoreductase [Acidobacteriota bacterium]
MPDPIRYGILGLGMGYSRAKLAHDYPNAEIGCVCALDADRAKNVAQEFGCAWTTDYEEMLARDDLDVIGVWTASGDHCRHATMALEAGFHASTTKPMDIRVAACQTAIAAAKNAGRVLAVDFGLRYEPNVRKVRQALRDGVIGRVLFADLQMKWMRAQDYYDGGEPAGWRSRTETEGGSIANQGVHMIDELYWLLGPVKTVEYGRRGTLAHDIETEDYCAASLTFQSGAWGLIETTTSAFPNRGTKIEINGSDGSILMEGDRNIQILRRNGDTIPLDDIVVDEDWPVHILDDMYRAIRLGKTPACPGIEGMRSVEIVEGVYAAADSGAKVELNQPPATC